MNANLNVASTKMSAMLCCSGEKDSAGRDLKSAQNTPSRQPMQPPYTMGTGQFMAPTPQPPQSQQPPQPYMGQQQQFRHYGPPPLSQQPQPGQPPPPGGGVPPRMMGPNQTGPNMAVNNYMGPKDDYRKVGQ